MDGTEAEEAGEFSSKSALNIQRFSHPVDQTGRTVPKWRRASDPRRQPMNQGQEFQLCTGAAVLGQCLIVGVGVPRSSVSF